MNDTDKNLPTAQDYIDAFKKGEFNPQRDNGDHFRMHQIEEFLETPTLDKIEMGSHNKVFDNFNQLVVLVNKNPNHI